MEVNHDYRLVQRDHDYRLVQRDHLSGQYSRSLQIGERIKPGLRLLCGDPHFYNGVHFTTTALRVSPLNFDTPSSTPSAPVTPGASG